MFFLELLKVFLSGNKALGPECACKYAEMLILSTFGRFMMVREKALMYGQTHIGSWNYYHLKPLQIAVTETCLVTLAPIYLICT